MAVKERLARHFLVLPLPQTVMFSQIEAENAAEELLKQEGSAEQYYIYELKGSRYKRAVVSTHPADVQERDPSIGEIEDFADRERAEHDREFERGVRRNQRVGERFDDRIHPRQLHPDPLPGQGIPAAGRAVPRRVRDRANFVFDPPPRVNLEELGVQARVVAAPIPPAPVEEGPDGDGWLGDREEDEEEEENR